MTVETTETTAGEEVSAVTEGSTEVAETEVKELTDDATSAPEAAAEVAEPEVPAYVPDYSYKVLDEKKELPEWTRGFITSKEDEARFREVFEKADGIDRIKRHRDEAVEQVKTIREQYDPIVEQVQMASHYFQQNDLENVFRVLGIPEQAVLKYTYNKLTLQEKPEQGQLYNETAELRRQNYELQRQHQMASQRLQDHDIQQRHYHLDQEISRPEVLDVAQSFDQRFGAGAFKQEVIKRGIAHHSMTGQDLSVAQAVSEVARLVAPPQATPVTQPQVSPEKAVVAPTGGKPALPNIKGNASSPARSEVRSIEDLRKIARSMG